MELTASGIGLSGLSAIVFNGLLLGMWIVQKGYLFYRDFTLTQPELRPGPLAKIDPMARQV